jgi:hypothetical protein
MNSQNPDKIVIVITTANHVIFINPSIMVIIIATMNVARQATTHHMGASEVPVLNFCLAIPPSHTTKKVKTSINGVRLGTAVAVSTTIASNPEVELGSEYKLILIRLPP